MFNVIREQVVPESLVAKKGYSEPDVLESLAKSFHDKCYICETKEPLSLNVEHFQAHKGCDVKKFDWNNLYYSCARCNNFKRHLFDDIVDCTDLSQDVLMLIRHAPPYTPYTKVVIEPRSDDPKVIRTAELISKVFNEDDTGNKAVAGIYIRKRVYKRYAKIVQHINAYIDEDELASNKSLAVEHLKSLMDVRQEFSAFLRWTIIDAPDLYEILKDSINTTANPVVELDA